MGLYTMVACVYQVDALSCGKYAWTEVQVLSFDDKDQSFWEKNQLYIAISGGLLVCLIIFSVVVIILCYRVKGMILRYISSEWM